MQVLAPYYDMGTIKTLWVSFQVLSSAPDVLDIMMPRPLSDFLAGISIVTQADAVSVLGGE